MPRWLFLLLGVLSELSAFIVYQNDSDHFSVGQLLSWQPHHELLLVLLIVVGAFSFGVYARRGRKKART